MHKIVVAEDEDYIWKLLEYKLKKQGYEVHRAKNGKLALELIQKVLPDIVLTDVMMPVLNGIQLIKTIKNDEKLKTIPCLMLSSQSYEENIMAGLEAGAEDYITKPFNPEEVLLRIKKILIRS